MSAIKSVGISLPQYGYSSGEIIEGAKSWLGSSTDQSELFERFVSSSQIRRRYFGIPLERILKGLPIDQKNEVFNQTGIELGVRAAIECLELAGVSPTEVDNLIFTSCSLPVIPSIDVNIIQQLGLPLSVRRIPIYQHGCAGGAAALGLASTLSESTGNTLVLSVELCSLVYQGADLSAGNLVGSALFGDGAAAVLVSPGRGKFQVIDSSSDLLPSSYDLMGYDLKEDGAHLRLKKELPGELARMAPKLVRDFLIRNNLASDQVAHWLIHPGGVKILKFLEEEFSLESSRSCYAWQVLEKYGNMSSASILFVLDEFLKSRRYKAGDKAIIIGIGPGLTLEQILIEIGD